MQKLSVVCWNKNLFNKLLETEVEKIIIGINKLSCRMNGYFDIDDLSLLCTLKNDKKIAICINNFFHESDIEFLEKKIIEISKYEIDEISFQDFAVAQIVYENNIKIKLNYNPETLNTNYEQIPFLLENNINEMTIARELTLHEIKEIANNKINIELEMQIHGFTYFMHSAWPMTSNFKKEINSKKIIHNNLDFYFIREESRDLKNIIFEDYQGTHMFSGFVLCGISKIKELEKIDYFKIDPIFRTEAWTINVIKIYSLYLENKITLNQAMLLFRKIEKNNILSESFLGKITNMPHFRQEKSND